MKAQNFVILRSESASTVEQQIRNLLEEGWELQGSMNTTRNPMLPEGWSSQTIGPNIYTQAMVLPKDAKSMEDQGYEQIVCNACKGKGGKMVDVQYGCTWQTCYDCRGRGFNWELKK